MSNEVTKGVSISFQVNELHFANITQKKLGCTLHDYQRTMRVVITSRFNFTLDTLQNDARVMRQFADNLSIPKDYDSAQLLAELIFLLPGNSDYRTEVLNEMEKKFIKMEILENKYQISYTKSLLIYMCTLFIYCLYVINARKLGWLLKCRIKRSGLKFFICLELSILQSEFGNDMNVMVPEGHI